MKRVEVLSEPPVRVEPAPIPADLKTCFNQLAVFPKDAQLNKKQVTDLLLKVRRSEIQKGQCGKRLIRWYDTVK